MFISLTLLTHCGMLTVIGVQRKTQTSEDITMETVTLEAMVRQKDGFHHLELKSVGSLFDNVIAACIPIRSFCAKQTSSSVLIGLIF